MNRKIILVAGAVLGIIIVGGGIYLALPFLSPEPKPVAAMGEPTDIVKDFYQPWLTAALSTTTNPYKEGLHKNLVLGAEVRTYLKKAQNDKETLDPVLCQPVIPPQISTRIVSASADKVEILVMSKPSGPPEQAVVTVLPLEGGWYIADIRCSPGEVAPVREFSFDNIGYLLKNVPAPLNAKNWHLIFSENGEDGHFAPLFFTPESTCKALDGTTGVCDPAAFVEKSGAHVQGEMTETGVQVKKVEFVKDQP